MPTDAGSETDIEPYALEAAIWRVLYRLHRKDNPQDFNQLVANLNVDDYLLMHACERLEKIGAVESVDDGFTVTDGRWGDRVLKTAPRVKP